MPTPEPQVRFARLPAPGPITGRFGDAYRDGARAWTHLGVDIGCPVGTPVTAPADGVAVEPYNDGSFGIAVAVEHPDGWVTLYAHLSRAAVSPGQRVERGQLLGWSGNTGLTTGPHLHWQLCDSRLFPRDERRNRDPLQYVSTEEDEMTAEERELLLKLATVVCGPPTGADFGSVGEALAAVRQLALQDQVLFLGLAQFQNGFAQHTHGPDGRPTWPGKGF